MKVTVAICTWNRADSLDRTLAGLRGLVIPPQVEWELLVVNNQCTDHTKEVLERHASILPIRQAFEPEPGLSNARNRGVAEARGDLILWTDDDVLVDPGWLGAYVEAALEWPAASYFGGTIAPLFEAEPPGWVRRNLKLLGSPFSLRQLGDETRPFLPGEAPFGANMAFRREALGLRPFDARLGRHQDDPLGGEETAVIERIALAGGLGIWVGPARVRHYIPVGRMTEDYLKRWYDGGGRTLARMGGPAAQRFLGVPRPAWERGWIAGLGSAGLASLLMLTSLTRGPIWMRTFQASARLRGFTNELHRLRVGAHSS